MSIEFPNLFSYCQIPVNDVAFSPNGTLLALALDGGTVRVMDPRIKEDQLQELNGHGSYDVMAVAFSPTNDTLLASGSDDNTVRLNTAHGYLAT